MEEKHNRRKFLSLGLLTGAGFLAGAEDAKTFASDRRKEDTVMLLSSDGNLVEVKRSIVQKARSGNKISHQEILNWTNLPKSK